MSTPLDPSKSAADAAEQPAVPSFEEQFYVFWQRNGTRVIIFCVAVAAGIAALYGFRAYQARVEDEIGRKYAAAETSAQLQAFMTEHAGHELAGVAQLRLADEAYAAAKYADAIVAYDKAIAALPAGPFGSRAQLGAAMARVAGGRTAEGEEILKKLAADSAQIEPVRAEALYQLFSFNQGAGKTEEAVKHADELFRLAPTSPWAQRAMAMRATMTVPTAPMAAPTAAPAAPAIQLNVPTK